MNAQARALAILVSAVSLAAGAGCRQSEPTAPTGAAPVEEWLTVAHSGLSVRAVQADLDLVPVVAGAIRDGETLATAFFSSGPLQPYTIAIYPDRPTLADHWRVAWQFPSYQPQCWEIAAAWATELDLLSPRVWNRDACGHDPNNTTHVRNVLAHEVTHVLHGQLGGHASLGSMVNAQWFTEGLATYVSGMLDVDYAGSVQSRLDAGFAPRTLAEVWSDQANYPLSASIVRYIDRRYGRAALRDMLGARSTSAILTRIGVSEAELMTSWRADSVARGYN